MLHNHPSAFSEHNFWETWAISDTPTSPDPSESEARPSGSILDTPVSPDPSGEFVPDSPSHQYESESSEAECGFESDIFY